MSPRHIGVTAVESLFTSRPSDSWLYRREYRIVVLGAEGVGKSSLTARFVQNVWIESYDPTIEDTYRKHVEVDGRQCIIEILDTASAEQFTAMRELYMKVAQGFLLVFSITNLSSFDELHALREQILRIKGDETVPLVVIGNKCDLKVDRAVPSARAIDTSDSWGRVPYYETSARRPINVNEAFVDLCRQLIRKDMDQERDLPYAATALHSSTILSKSPASKLPSTISQWRVGRFLHPTSRTGRSRSLHSSAQDRRMKVDDPSNVTYNISSTRGLRPVMLDVCKRGIEHIIGCQLSWWPLAAPEDKPVAGHIRVYSMALRGQHVYDDIPMPLAESLFADLANIRAQAPKSSWSFLNQEAVLLYNSTLMRLLLTHFASQAMTDTTKSGGHIHSAGEPTSNNAIGQRVQTAQTEGEASSRSQAGNSVFRSDNKLKNKSEAVVTDYERSGGDDEDYNPVLFLSVGTEPNEFIARTVTTQISDKATFQSLYAAYRSISTGRQWFRRVIGMRFYRFDSFLFKETLGIHYIDIHKDKERYPTESDPEYRDYSYAPRPWPPEIPYPSREVWHYFMHPEDCGTSKKLKSMLPVRFKGPIMPRSRAFGIHIEERLSVLAIFVPVLIIVLITLGATFWFLPFWLNSHPGDLQNATVPVMVAFTVIGLLLQLLASLSMFRWANS